MADNFGGSLAGADSTASTTQSFLHHILREPSIYQKILAEIDEASSSGQLSPVVQWSEAQSLPYFQACLKEVWRMRPPVGLAMGRVVPKGGTTIGGVRYEEGTGLAVNRWVVHRDKAVFSEDADVYRPKRWLENKERARVMDLLMVHVRVHLFPLFQLPV